MAKRFYKYKLLLDEHMDDRRAYPALNERFDVKHVSADLRAGGLSDPKVYELAVETGRILITRNTKDFRDLVGTREDAGVIGIPPHTPAANNATIGKMRISIQNCASVEEPEVEAAQPMRAPTAATNASTEVTLRAAECTSTST